MYLLVCGLEKLYLVAAFSEQCLMRLDTHVFPAPELVFVMQKQDSHPTPNSTT
jgi:hypothetical protein